MLDNLKKLWYILAIIGLIVLGVAIYSAFFRSEELRRLLARRPVQSPGSLKLPKAPTIVDYVDLYKKRLKQLQ